MDPIRPKLVRKGPFPGSHIPLKLRQIFREAGIEPTLEGRIPWNQVPYVLYDKGVYITGLPALLFFANDKPSPEEITRRLKEVLKWPPTGSMNPLSTLENACMIEGRVKLLPRPAARDVVFEMISEDGTRFDLGKWKAPPPGPWPPRRPTLKALKSTETYVPTISLVSPVQPNGVAIPARTTSDVKSGGEGGITQPVTQAKPAEAPRSTESMASVRGSTSKKEPYPKSTAVPLELRKMLSSIGVQESQRHPGKVGWSTVPHILWKKGYYITGIPSSAILDSKNPSIDMIDQKMKYPFILKNFSLVETAFKNGDIKLLKRPPGREVVFEVITGSGPYDLGKWNDRERVESSTKPVKESTSTPKLVTTTTLPLKPSLQPPPPPKVTAQPVNFTKVAKSTTPLKILRKNSRIIASSDEDEEEPPTPASGLKSSDDTVFLDPISNPFPGSINVPVNLRRLFDVAGVKELSDKDTVPWAHVPYVLWRRGYYISGLPREFILGKSTPEEVNTKLWQPQDLFRTNSLITQAIIDGFSNGKIRLMKREDARNVVFEIEDAQGHRIDIGRWTAPEPITADDDTDIEGEDAEDGERDPKRKWFHEVDKVLDQLAEMLVEAGVDLPPHPKRKNAYKIPWAELPGLLHAAKVTLAGFPLNLLPYWRTAGRLNGQWAIRWMRESLDTIANLLDCDAIVVEKWENDSNVVVQAFDPNNDQYDFTVDHFVNAIVDDPERIAKDGVVSRALHRLPPNRRKRKASSDSESERAPKRYKSQHGRTHSTSTVDVIEMLQDSDDDAEFSSTSFPGNGVDSLTGQSFYERMETDEIDDSVAPGSQKTDSIVSRSKGFMSDVPLYPDIYWEPPRDPDLSISALNEIAQRHKEILKGLIAILIYANIPCIAPADERLAYFLPWSNLPRHLAARSAYVSGFPDVCAPVVVDDTVVPESGPACWSDSQWDALETALKSNAIALYKTTRKVLFELVSSDGEKSMSAVNFSRSWLNFNFGVEAGQAITVMADGVEPMDPILIETEDESEEEDDDDDEVSMEE